MQHSCNGSPNDTHNCHESMNKQTPTQHPYLPLLVVIAVSSALGALQAYMMHHLSFHVWMNVAMGYYLVLMATMKFFDINMFGENYLKYDLISQMVPSYAYAYPVIELVLGAFFINSIAPYLSNVVMAVVMTSSLCGIIYVLIKGEVKPCACMGIIVNVPLGIVSIAECALMVVMALMNIFGSGH